MEKTNSSAYSGIALKVDIEGFQVIRSLIVPTNKFLNYGNATGLRVNQLGFYVWCEVCTGRVAKTVCETENNKPVCWVCNLFCNTKLHVWKDLECPVHG